MVPAGKIAVRCPGFLVNTPFSAQFRILPVSSDIAARFALAARLHYIQRGMTSTNFLPCDGCGQPASPEHIARRLKRLEWTTRYRPVHIHTLFLGAFSPDGDAGFLYSPGEVFQGEAAVLLEVAGISIAGKSADTVHAEFQRRGFFLTHVLECPVEKGLSADKALDDLLAQRAPAVATRIRRSLKPKRVVLVSGTMEALARQWMGGELGCPVLLEEGKPFALDGPSPERTIARLRASVETPVSAH